MVIGVVLLVVIRYYDHVVVLLLLTASLGIHPLSGSRPAPFLLLLPAFAVVTNLLILLVLLFVLLLEEVEPSNLPLHRYRFILLNGCQMREHPPKAIRILELIDRLTV